MRQFTIVGLGEVLWDIFPGHKQLGGAPANFAYISRLLGDRGLVASRVGNDSLGDEVFERLRALRVDLSFLQRDPVHLTGTVNVEVASDGQPRFEIVHNVAWDFLEWNNGLATLAGTADAVCFGTLAQRQPDSRKTIMRFLGATRKDAVRVFDVNLRQHFYTPEILAASAEHTDILKLNHEEIPVVMKAIDGPELPERESAQWLLQRFGLKLVCVTRGGSGSLLITPNTHDEHSGFKTAVADTVGAGDAFTATMVHHYLRGSDLAEMNAAANRMGAWVAGKPGATPPPEDQILELARARTD